MLRNYLLLAALCTATTISPVTQPAQGSTSTQTTTQADSSKKAKPSVFSRVKTFCCDNKKAIVVCLTVAATGATVYYIVRKMNANQKALLENQSTVTAEIHEHLRDLQAEMTRSNRAYLDKRIADIHAHIHENEDVAQAQVQDLHQHLRDLEDTLQARVAPVVV